MSLGIFKSACQYNSISVCLMYSLCVPVFKHASDLSEKKVQKCFALAYFSNETLFINIENDFKANVNLSSCKLATDLAYYFFQYGICLKKISEKVIFS